jgi:hypothetical protein
MLKVTLPTPEGWFSNQLTLYFSNWPILWRLRNSGGAIDAALSRPAPPCGVGKMAKRKMLFHSDYLREKIRASKLINRLHKCAFGEISLTMTQLRAIEILLRKRLPDLAAAEIETEQTQRYVVEIPPLLENVEWQEKYGPQIEDQTVQ